MQEVGTGYLLGVGSEGDTACISFYAVNFLNRDIYFLRKLRIFFLVQKMVPFKVKKEFLENTEN